MYSRRRFIGASAIALQAQPIVRAAQVEQFTARTALVFAPTTVRDGSDKFVRGIEAGRFILLDNGVPRSVNLDEEGMPVALVLVCHATFDARKPLDRMRKAASLFEPMIVGENGSAALLAVRENVEVVVPFTSSVHLVERGLRTLVAQGSGCSFVDGVNRAAELLRERPQYCRKVIIVMAEDRDRSSNADLQETLIMLEKQNTTVYCLTYSTGLMQLGKEVPIGP